MLQPITKHQAELISIWHYPEPYTVYSFDGSSEIVNELLTENYYALEQNKSLFGFACFGQSARIPCIEEGIYEDYSNILDIGLGLNPELCGKGQGKELLSAIFNYAETLPDTRVLRLSVANFNERAIRLYKQFGFSITTTMTHKGSGVTFYLMEVSLGDLN